MLPELRMEGGKVVWGGLAVECLRGMRQREVQLEQQLSRGRYASIPFAQISSMLEERRHPPVWCIGGATAAS